MVDDTGPHPAALGLIESRSVARGMIVVDALVKKAPVAIETSHTISPGHYVTVFSGGVSEVEESLQEGIQVAGELLLDHVFLPQVHGQIPEAMRGLYAAAPSQIETLAVLETHTVSGTILAADAACKAAAVSIVRVGLGQGLGGKAFFVLTGTLHDIEAAVDAGTEAIADDILLTAEIVARPHPDFIATYEL